MTYRDETEALRARLAEAESQRDEAQTRALGMEKELADWPARLAREKAVESASRSRGRFPWLLTVGLVAACAGFVFGRCDAPALQRELDGVREISAMWEYEAKQRTGRIEALEGQLRTETEARRRLEEQIAAPPAPEAH